MYKVVIKIPKYDDNLIGPMIYNISVSYFNSEPEAYAYIQGYRAGSDKNLICTINDDEV